MMPLTLDDQFETMPWEMLDNVVFDVGNVLLSFSPDTILREHFPEEKALHDVLYWKIFRSPYWVMLDHGILTQEEAIAAMCAHTPELEMPIRCVMDNWLDLKFPVEEGIRALKTCKAQGKKLYVLSNYHQDAFDFIRRKFDFFNLFDGMVVSSRVKLVKPDPVIYHHLIDTFGLKPARTLFIDDTPANIEMALHEGWQGLCFNHPGQLDAFVKAE